MIASEILLSGSKFKIFNNFKPNQIPLEKSSQNYKIDNTLNIGVLQIHNFE